MSQTPITEHIQQPQLVLYSRPECHLCDVAAALLKECDQAFEIQDIEADLNLIRRYGTRIPVLYRPDTKTELFWPFSEGQVLRFMETSL